MKNLKIAIIVSIVLLSAHAGLAKTALPNSALLLPDEVMVFVNVNEYSALEKNFQTTSLYKLWNDASMKAFKKSLEDNLLEKIKQEDDELVDLITDVNAMPQGRISFAVMIGDNVLENEQAGFVIIAEFGENLDKAKKNIQKAFDKTIEQGATKKTANMRGVEVVTLLQKREPLKQPDMEKLYEMKNAPDYDPETFQMPMKEIQRSPFTLRYCFMKDVFVATGDVKEPVMDFVISHIKGDRGRSLADLPNYSAIKQATASANGIDIFVNFKPIFDMVKKEDPSGAQFAQMQMMGITNISAFGLGMDVGKKPGESIAAKALLKIDGEKKGIIKMLDMETASVKVPTFIDADCGSLAAFNWDIKKAYAELVKMVTAIQPQAAAMLNVPIMTPDGSKMLTINDDILAHFGSQIIVSEGFDEENADKPTNTSLVCAAVNDGKSLDESLGVVHGMYLAMGKKDLVREFLGHKIYLIDVAGFAPFMTGGMPTPSNDQMVGPQMQTPKIGLTVTDTHLIVGLEKDIERSLRLLKNRQAQGLETKKWFRAARRLCPPTVGMAGFKNDRIVFKKFWKMLKEKEKTGNENEMTIGLSTAGPEIFSEFIDFKKLPDFEAVKKYFGISGGYLISRPDGFYYEARSVDLPE